jgi:hypothetical protein
MIVAKVTAHAGSGRVARCLVLADLYDEAGIEAGGFARISVARTASTNSRKACDGSPDAAHRVSDVTSMEIHKAGPAAILCATAWRNTCGKSPGYIRIFGV